MTDKTIQELYSIIIIIRSPNPENIFFLFPLSIGFWSALYPLHPSSFPSLIPLKGNWSFGSVPIGLGSILCSLFDIRFFILIFIYIF